MIPPPLFWEKNQNLLENLEIFVSQKVGLSSSRRFHFQKFESLSLGFGAAIEGGQVAMSVLLGVLTVIRPESRTVSAWCLP